MRSATEAFCKAIEEKWGNPYEVAEAGISELHDQRGQMDHPDHVELVKRIGVLAGLTQGGIAVDFIAGFEEQVLNGTLPWE